MESMTGYSYLEAVSKQFSFYVEIKSVNSKYCELNVNIPRVLKLEETAYSELVRSKINRGKVELNVEITDWFEEKKVEINETVLMNYYKELKRVEC